MRHKSLARPYMLAMDENPVQYLLRKYLKMDGGSYKPEEIRAKLGKFGLPGRAVHYTYLVPSFAALILITLGGGVPRSPHLLA